METEMKVEDGKFIPKNRQIIEGQYVSSSCEGDNFGNYIFRDIGANKLTFRGVNFSFCIFDNAYLKDCKFENCKFTGAKFYDSNLRGSSFSNCEFQYSYFKGTDIPCKEMLINLSSWPNVNRDWLRRLRINYEGLGDVASVKACVRQEMLASREHLRKAREAKEGYYAKSYKGFRAQLLVRLESLTTFLDWHLWGHGERPHKLFVTVCAIVLLSATYHFFRYYQLEAALAWGDIVKSFFYSLRDVTYSFIGVGQASVPDGMNAILSLIRYIALGLFISVLYKSIARR